MKIAIFHFSPLEHFPPVMNLINFLGQTLPPGVSVRVYTTISDTYTKNFSVNKNDRVTIVRFGDYGFLNKTWKRYILYSIYNISTFFSCLFWRATSILYYESFSAMPAYWIKRLKKSSRIFIHYHEYVSPEEYKRIKLLNIIHELERKIYQQAAWISHTNEKRMQLFLQDIAKPQLSNARILPNYPPEKWLVKADEKIIKDTIHIVYVGALSMDTMYIKEFVNWIETHHGALIWDIYSQQPTAELETYLNTIDSAFIRIKGMVDYERLPEILPNYDVGVILHKGQTNNYKYNAPNKLFEYLACGLDVWFPDCLEGSIPYTTGNSFPQVKALAFDNLGHYNVQALVCRDEKQYKASAYFCEFVYPKLLSELSSTGM